jgi:hypothetical protein
MNADASLGKSLDVMVQERRRKWLATFHPPEISAKLGSLAKQLPETRAPEEASLGSLNSDWLGIRKMAK